MNNPFFWLGLSILLVAISLMALLLVAVLTLQELARAARSAEKLLDTLNREMPATLQDLRLTGKELALLSDEVSGSVQSARSVVEQVDQGLLDAKAQAQKAQITTRSLWAGATAAFKVLTNQPRRRRTRPPTRRPPVPKPPVPKPPVPKPPVNSPRQATDVPAETAAPEQIVAPVSDAPSSLTAVPSQNTSLEIASAGDSDKTASVPAPSAVDSATVDSATDVRADSAAESTAEK
ncbi:MAG: DUF948 domain-containing protein [Cyanobacteria bacterium J06649_5]